MKTLKTFPRIARMMAMTTTVATLSACGEETNLVENSMDAVGITVGMADTPVPTRAAYNPNGGKLKLMYKELASQQTSTFTCNGSGWTTDGALYWQQLSAVNGKYPFYAVMPADASTANSSVAANQSKGITASDLMMAYAEPSYKNTIALEFSHLLSMVEVNLSDGGGMTADELAGAALTIDGLKTAYTLIAGNSTSAPATATAKGSSTNGLKPMKNGANFQFIAPAQELAANGLTMDFTVTINGEKVSYTYKNDDALTLVAGKKTVFNITISKTALSLGDVVVTDWVEGTFASAALRIAVTGTAEELEGTAGNITFLDIAVADGVRKNATYDGQNQAQQQMLHNYTKSDGGTWSSTNPIYLDALTADHVLYASTINVDANGGQIQDAKTGLYDYLGSDAVEVKGGAAAFALRHLMAQMTVKLATGTGFTASLEGATITTPNMITAANLGTDADGNMAMKAGDASGAYSVSSETTHLVVPQTLAANSIFTVQLANNNTYEAKLSEAVELAAGVNTTIILTLMPTQVGVAATVTEWGTAAASATVQLARTSSEVALNRITEAGDLTLTYVLDNALSNTATTFSFDGKAWTNDTPLYWDQITLAAPYTFAAFFTPETAGTVETDYLVGKGTAQTHGAQVVLGELKHAMAKMTITLAAGTNVTADELVALNRTLNVKKSTAVSVNVDGTAHITMPDDVTAADFTSGTSFFVAPQALTDANTIVLARANGNTYTVKLTDLKDYNQAVIFTDNKITAGQHYQIELTVNETSVGISAAIAPWTEKNGSGTATPDFQ